MADPGAEYWREVEELDNQLYGTGIHGWSPNPIHRALLYRRSRHAWGDSEGRHILWSSERLLSIPSLAVASHLAVIENPPTEGDTSVRAHLTHYNYAVSKWFPRRLLKEVIMIELSDYRDSKEEDRFVRDVRRARADQRRLGLETPEDKDYADLLGYLQNGAAGNYQNLLLDPHSPDDEA